MKKLVSWVEIPSKDFTRAVNFYSKVFELQLEVFEYESEKMACFPSGEGAVFYAEGYLPSTEGVIVNFNVSDNIENTVKRIEENGGKIIRPKTKIEAEGRGYFALFIDSEGNKLGIYGDE
ncbi:MAG: VOC family protein [Bacteroidales bacterium]|jgi:predicted enzyme related to lactoylglutathione lyase|nr:VOC family protein [Bacteroidales bacterium]